METVFPLWSWNPDAPIIWTPFHSPTLTQANLEFVPTRRKDFNMSASLTQVWHGVTAILAWEKECAEVKGTMDRYESQMMASVRRIEQHEEDIKKDHKKKKHIDLINAERRKLEVVKAKYHKLARELMLDTGCRYEDAKRGLSAEMLESIEESEVVECAAKMDAKYDI